MRAPFPGTISIPDPKQIWQTASISFESAVAGTTLNDTFAGSVGM
jgi:hypothetical protein